MKPQPGEPLFAGDVWAQPAFDGKLEIHSSYERLAEQVRTYTVKQTMNHMAATTLFDAMVIAGDSLYPTEKFVVNPPLTDSEAKSTAPPPPETEYDRIIRYIHLLEKNAPTEYGASPGGTQSASPGDKPDKLSSHRNGSVSLLATNIHRIVLGFLRLRAWHTYSEDKTSVMNLCKNFDWWPMVSFATCGVRGLIISPTGGAQGGKKPRIIANALGMIKMVKEMVVLAVAEDANYKIYEDMFIEVNRLIMDFVLKSGYNKKSEAFEHHRIDNFTLAKVLAYDFGKYWTIRNPNIPICRMIKSPEGNQSVVGGASQELPSHQGTSQHLIQSTSQEQSEDALESLD